MKKKGIDFKLKKLLIIKQLLLVTTIGHLCRLVCRICIQVLQCLGVECTATPSDERIEDLTVSRTFVGNHK